MPELSRVFVYGTLRSNGSNAFRMGGARSLGLAKIQAKLYAVHEEYPGAVLSDDVEDVLVGEVFHQVDDDLLSALDAYEGCDDSVLQEHRIYKRVEVSVVSDGGGRMSAFFWEYIGETIADSQIASGDWFVRRS